MAGPAVRQDPKTGVWYDADGNRVNAPSSTNTQITAYPNMPKYFLTGNVNGGWYEMASGGQGSQFARVWYNPGSGNISIAAPNNAPAGTPFNALVAQPLQEFVGTNAQNLAGFFGMQTPYEKTRIAAQAAFYDAYPNTPPRTDAPSTSPPGAPTTPPSIAPPSVAPPSATGQLPRDEYARDLAILVAQGAITQQEAAARLPGYQANSAGGAGGAAAPPKARNPFPPEIAGWAEEYKQVHGNYPGMAPANTMIPNPQAPWQNIPGSTQSLFPRQMMDNPQAMSPWIQRGYNALAGMNLNDAEFGAMFKTTGGNMPWYGPQSAAAQMGADLAMQAAAQKMMEGGAAVRGGRSGPITDDEWQWLWHNLEGIEPNG